MIKTLLKSVREYKRDSILAPIFVTLEVVMEVVIPLLMAMLIDKGIDAGNMNYILKIGIALAISCVISLVFGALSGKFAASASAGFAKNLRKDMFHHIQEFSFSNIDRFSPSSLVTRLTTDITNVQNFLSMLLRIGILAPMMAVAGLVFSSATGGKVSSVLAIAVPVLIAALSAIVVLASRYSVKLRRKLDRINRLFLESLEGVRVIRAFNQQETERGRFRQANRDYALTAMAAGRITSLLLPAINVIFGVTTAAILGLGAHYVDTGAMEVGSLVANSQYISMVLTSVIMLSLVIMMFPTTYACAARIAEVLETETGIRDGDYPFKQRPLRSTLEFRHVTFAYPGADEPILKDISFSAHPGEVTAIIGGTGRGKSSILKLIPRLYDPLFGEILVDGVNIRRYRVDDLRSIIGYVPQKNVLFSGDIASNLNFGKEDGTEKDWARAAGIACAAEFIAKKQGGYHDPIAQGGSNLSGGQRQRMAIARALIKRPEIYVFDDSFSALDMKTDQTLRQNLKESMGEAAVILVAQRVSTILDADRILVVDDGRIVGQGTHGELLRTCPLYREIAEIQLGKEAV